MLELHKYLKHHGLDKYMKSTKNDKILVITRCLFLLVNAELGDNYKQDWEEETKLTMNVW